MVFSMGIMPQDAYYFFYSEHLSLSYFDHPPGVAIMLWAFIHILGSEVWGLKLIDFLVTGASLVVIYYLSRQFLSKSRSLNVLFILGSTLLITDVSIVTTPDVPLLLFWTLSLLLMYRAIRSGRIREWVFAGLTTGIAFDCKYTALYLPLALIFYLILARKDRRYIFSLQLATFIISFIAVILPVILWNVDHDFASFRFQSGDRMSSILEFKLRPVYFFATIGHQMLLLLPFLAMVIGVVFWKHVKRGWNSKALPDESTLFLLCMSMPMIIAFLMISWIYWVKINWLIPAYTAAAILAIRYMSGRSMKMQMWTAVVFNGLLLAQIAWYPVNIQSDDTYWGWKTLAREVASLKERFPDSFVFSADSYKTTAILNYYLDETVYAGNVIGLHALEYSITDADLSHLHGRNALFIDSRPMVRSFDQEHNPREVLNVYFDELIIQSPITLYDRRGRALRQFAVVECRNYRPVSN